MSLIIGGKEVHCDLPVANWHEHGMEAKVGDGSRRRNPKVPIDLFVLHWTGGEGDAHGCFAVLDQRELGVEFCIDREGDIFQFADPVLVDTFDAGYVNPRSAGVEITNYGFREIASQIPKYGRDRVIYETTMRGKRRKMARFYDTQIKAAIALADALTAAIPTLPRALLGKDANTLFTGSATRKQIAAYKGLVGHYQLTDGKSDPGTDLPEAIHATGRYPYTPIS